MWKENKTKAKKKQNETFMMMKRDNGVKPLKLEMYSRALYANYGNFSCSSSGVYVFVSVVIRHHFKL